MYKISKKTIMSATQKYNLGFDGITQNDERPEDSTKISDIITKPTEYAYLDEVKKMKTCKISFVDYRLGTSPFEENNNVVCFWDTEPINNTSLVFGCPISHVSDVGMNSYYSVITKDFYKISENLPPGMIDIKQKLGEVDIVENDYYLSDGIFCSPFCAKAFIKNNKGNPLYVKSEFLLSTIYRKMTGDESYIKSSPHWRMLKKFGGPMSIEQFRDQSKNCIYNKTEFVQKMCKNIYKPMGFVFEEKVLF
jgi:hypothetical protein